MAQMNRSPDRLVIFDCDGVLVDSEPIAARLTAEAVSELGWEMTAELAKSEFLGDTFSNIIRRVEEKIGAKVPEDWPTRSQRNLLAALERELTPVSGVRGAIEALVANGVTLAVGSQGSHEKMQVTLAVTGLLPFFEGRIFSASQVSHPKPAPDLFLLAAATLGVPPSRAVVVEDSTKGVKAALAAGMRVLGYTASVGHAAIVSAGAEPIDDLADLPARLGF
ncbi:MAG: haloacid dehalogenase [Polyangiaceae bacterium]|jgi:HAD superfamily hydrolase (TIGR01509 family)|nr:haloacid dehalogenase [Polyangiaceae bacterium]